jgi:hypothetical protein
VELSTPSGPVTARAEIDVRAIDRVVWSVIADIAAWPTWNPAVREALFTDDLEVGARFRYASEFGSMRCTLREVDAPRTLAWSGRVMLIGQQQAWRIEARGNTCHVTTVASMRGLGARFFKGRLGRRLQGELDALVQLLKLEAETRTAESAESAEDAARGPKDHG